MYGGIPRPPSSQAMIAPRPQRMQPDLPAQMAQNLDNTLTNQHAHQEYNPGGFVVPTSYPNFIPPPPPPPLPTPGPFMNPYGSDAPAYTTAPFTTSPSRAPAALLASPPPLPPAPTPVPPPPPVPTAAGGPPSLTAPLPTVASLQAALSVIQSPSADLPSRIAWIRDVLLLATRAHAASLGAPDGGASAAGTDLPASPGAIRLSDPTLARLVNDHALPLLLQIAPGPPQSPAQPQKLSPSHAEGLYMRAALEASGAFPAHIPQNQRAAFRCFEAAARAGHTPAWFRLGRDYEAFGDAQHAKECFERGARARPSPDPACLYRLGMAHLLGQLACPRDPSEAAPLLRQAAVLATVAAPQPAYAFALLLLGELGASNPSVSPNPNSNSSPAAHLPPNVLTSLIPPGSTSSAQARKHLERAAYLHFAPAQYRLGRAHEFAEDGYAFDPLLSVQYYALASAAGARDADMALSKWFLCGADGCFGKDERLARTFAEKAAKRGLESAEFAMGYYCEVGIGAEIDVDTARIWYQRALEHGSTDAAPRLAALNEIAGPKMLSRAEHETLTESTLVRKRTQAKQRADARYGAGGRQQQSQQQQGYEGAGESGYTPGGFTAGGGYGRAHGERVVELIRKESLAPNQATYMENVPPLPRTQSAQGQGYNPPHPRTSSLSSGVAGNGGGGGARPSPQQQQQQQQQPQQQFANRPRYSLADPGSSPNVSGTPPPASNGPAYFNSGPGGAGGGRPGRPGRIASGPGAGAGSGGMQTPPRAGSPPNAGGGGAGTKYNTFAEMGIHASKAEEKECVIM